MGQENARPSRVLLPYLKGKAKFQHQIGDNAQAALTNNASGGALLTVVVRYLYTYIPHRPFVPQGVA
jgi:hypothetical protein